MNRKMASLVVAALIVCSVVAGVASVAPKAAAAKATPVVITMSTSDDPTPTPVANHAKLTFQDTGTTVTFALTGSGTGSWAVTRPTGLGGRAFGSSVNVDTPDSGVYTVSFTNQGATRPSWSATITIPFSVSMTTSDDPTPTPVANHAKLTFPTIGTTVTFTATQSGTWSVTTPTVSSISSGRSVDVHTPQSGVYTVTFTKQGSNNVMWSATITIPFSVSISTSDNPTPSPVASGTAVSVQAGTTVTFAATQSGTWGVTTPTVSSISSGTSLTFGTPSPGTYSIVFTKEGATKQTWSATVTAT